MEINTHPEYNKISNTQRYQLMQIQTDANRNKTFTNNTESFYDYEITSHEINKWYFQNTILRSLCFRVPTNNRQYKSFVSLALSLSRSLSFSSQP